MKYLTTTSQILEIIMWSQWPCW